MATAELTTIQTDELEQEIAPVIAQANAIVVNSPDSYRTSVEFLQAVKAKHKQVVEFFQPMKSAAHAAWKAVVSQEKSSLDSLESAETVLKKKASDYQAAEERKRRLEQARLQAEADERARVEREKLERAAAKLKTPERREQKLAEAASVAAPVISVAPTTPKVEGVTMRTTWKHRVVDAMAVPREYLMVNEKQLDLLAKSTKGNVTVSGVEFYAEQSMAVGRS